MIALIIHGSGALSQYGLFFMVAACIMCITALGMALAIGNALFEAVAFVIVVLLVGCFIWISAFPEYLIYGYAYGAFFGIGGVIVYEIISAPQRKKPPR